MCNKGRILVQWTSSVEKDLKQGKQSSKGRDRKEIIHINNEAAEYKLPFVIDP